MKKITFLVLFLSVNSFLFGQDEILISADIMPSFSRCESLNASHDYDYCNERTFLEFMYDNIKYPKEARDSNVQGGLQVEFIIDKNGKVKEPKVTIGLGHGCDEEVIRVLKLMNDEPQMWLAGEDRGEAVNVRVWKFIYFKLPPNGVEMKDIKEELLTKPKTRTSLKPTAYQRIAKNKIELNRDANDEIFTVVENMPVFPGCDSLQTESERKQCTERNLLKYMYQNIKYPDAARENGVEGLIVVQFVIEKDGSVSRLNVLKSIGSGCDFEVIRVLNTFIEKGMKWTPGMQRNQPVLVRYNLPIRFKLAG